MCSRTSVTIALRAALEQALEDLGPAEQAHQRAHDHHGHAPPQRPLVHDLHARNRHDDAAGPDAGDDVARLDHDRRKDHEIDERAQQAAGRDRDAHEAADPEHRGIEREAQSEHADVGTENGRDVLARLPGRGVVVRIEALVECPRLLHPRPLVHAQDLELQQLHPAVADDGLVDAGESAVNASSFALNMPSLAAPV